MRHFPGIEVLEPNESIQRLTNYFFAPYITLAHIFNAPAGWKIDTRALKQYQLQYVIEGVAEYVVEGNHYLTRRGDLLFHRPHERHSVHTLAQQPYLCVSIVFHFGTAEFPLHLVIGEQNYLGNYHNTPIESLLSQIVANYHQPSLEHQLLCQSQLLQLFSGLGVQKREKEPKENVSTKSRARLVLVKNYISEHYMKPIRHADLERISGLSRNYLILQFKSVYGMTPFDYLSWVRVERAKEMAIQHDLTYTEIAERIGYADVHTFGRMFKKKTGMSLSQYCAAVMT
jgi:AraC-like DNA-binding protein